MENARNTPGAAVEETGAEEQEQPAPAGRAGEPEAPVAPARPAANPAEDPKHVAEDPKHPAEDPKHVAENPKHPDDESQGTRAMSPETPQDDEAKVEHDLEELAAKAEKADHYLELAQRTKADFENYRKRAAREAGAAQERGVVRLAKELLPAVDNLDRAVEAVESASNGADLLAGIKLVHAEVLAALARVGVEPFDPAGEAFDPSWHEAVAHQPVEGAAAGTVAEVYQRGYRLRDTVIRPARVLVAG